jgi:probable HAF family extracellular repeat protein
VNNSGQVVGGNFIANSNHAFLYAQGQITDLGTFGGESEAHGINDKGQITGYSYYTDNSQGHAFLYENGQLNDIGTLPGDTAAFGNAINANGAITGDSYSETGLGGHAFIYTNGQMTDLGVLPGFDNSEGLAINAKGEVAGSVSRYSDSTGLQYVHPFLYSGGHMIDLGTLGGERGMAYGINDSGQAVGSFEDQKGAYNAFLYSDGNMVDLNALIAGNPGWRLEEAVAINNSGLILVNGSGPTAGLYTHALILTPTAVPLPGAVWLFGSILTGLNLLAKRLKKA